MKTFANVKGAKADSKELRYEMRDQNIMPHLWPQPATPSENGNLRTKPPPAPWIWNKYEYQRVVSILSSIWAPTGYGSSLQYKFTAHKKVVGMKTHDWHNILHDLLPIAIRGTLTPEIRGVIYRLRAFFKWICNKKISIADIHRKKTEATEILCLMQQYFSPSIFDIELHLVEHLVPKIEMAGLVSYRWMYFVERYMKVLKDFVWQRSRPEGSMAEGYLMSQAMHFITEYSRQIDRNCPWHSHLLPEGDPKITCVYLPPLKIARK